MNLQRIFLRRTINLLFIGLLALSCSVSHVTGKKQFLLISEEQEIQMGKEYDPQVIAAFGEYRNDQILAFLVRKEKELAAVSDWPELTYHIRILDSPVVNAFAVPGGYIYLTRGLLAQVNNEAELAGIMGHEMGHITARHIAAMMTKQQVGQLLLVAGMIASEDFRKYANYAMAGMELLFLKFSRDDEREADELGVIYSSRIGYDAHKMADFFRVLQKMDQTGSQGGVPEFLSTHPDPGDRYATVNQLATQWQDSLGRATYAVNQDSYLRLIDGIVYGDDPRQGYVEGNTFYHPEMRFSFILPSGWKVENTPAQVNIAPADGKALIVFTHAPNGSLQDAATKNLYDLGLTVQSSRNITVNGLPALKVISTQTTQDPATFQPLEIKALSCFITYNKQNYVFHGVSEQASHSAYVRLFESSMMSFSQLTDPSKVNVRPKKILVKTVTKAGTASEALKALGVSSGKMNEVALLNNLGLADRVEAGRLVKVIGE